MTTIRMLRDLIEKEVYNMQEHLSKISRETEMQTKNQKKMPAVTESTETKLKKCLG